MPYSDCRSHIKAGRVIVGAAILAFALAIVVASFHLISAPGGDAKRHWAPTFSSAEPYAPYHNADCQSPKDREEANLCQQWRVAEATEKTVAVAEAQKVWAILQVCLTAFATLATGLAAFAAAKAANATTDAVEITAKAERPVIFLTKIEAVVTETERSVKGIALHFENAGRLPATFNVISFWGRDTALVSKDFFQDVTDNQSFVLRRNDKVKIEALRWDVSATSSCGEWPIFVRGALRYDSQLGVRKWVYFCFAGTLNRETRWAGGDHVIWRKHGGKELNYEYEEREPGKRHKTRR